MTLSNQQREALYAHVTNILTLRIHTRHKVRDPSTVGAFMGEIASVTHQAMSDVVERWNQQARTVLYRLPMELLAHSFSWLDPPERVRLTAVSRYLRSVALGDPSLWAQIKFGKKHRYRREDTLALLLERSGSAMLDVDIYDLIPGIEDVLLAQHVRRMRTLILDNTDTVLWIFEHPAPVLEVLELPELPYVDDEYHTVLPSPSWAPLLRRLQLSSTFALPSSTGPFHRVTYFSGYLTAREGAITDARALFEVFPSLEILKLSFNGSSSAHNMPNTPVPRTLVQLILSQERDGDNIPSSLALWRGFPFRVVHLMAGYRRVAAAALEHMHSVTSGSWHIDMEEYRLTLRMEHGAVYRIDDDVGRIFNNLSGHLDSLYSIVSVPRTLQLQLIAVFNMPSLHSVTLRGPFMTLHRGWQLFSGRLRVPGLQMLRLEPERHDEESWHLGELHDCSQYTEELVRRLTLEDGSELPRIPRFVFSEFARPYVREEYWSWIYQRASSVYIEDELLWQEDTDK